MFFLDHVDPLMDLKKKKRRSEVIPKFLIANCIYGVFATVSVLLGTRWVPCCISKQNSQQRQHLGSFFSCLKKFKCLGDVLDSVTPITVGHIEVPSFERFYNLDVDLAQHFSCSVKTVECGQIFLLLLACQQLRKKAQHNFIGIAQFENLLNLSTKITND